MTIGAWNVFRLPEIINYLISIGVICAKHRHQNFFINLLQFPAHYHVSVLPDEFRNETIDKLKTFIVSHNKKYNTTIDHAFTYIIHELEKPHDPVAAKKFLHVSKQVDDVRNENIFEVIPELKILC
jgi:hypothetical protein